MATKTTVPRPATAADCLALAWLLTLLSRPTDREATRRLASDVALLGLLVPTNAERFAALDRGDAMLLAFLADELDDESLAEAVASAEGMVNGWKVALLATKQRPAPFSPFGVSDVRPPIVN